MKWNDQEILGGGSGEVESFDVTTPSYHDVVTFYRAGNHVFGSMPYPRDSNSNNKSAETIDGILPEEYRPANVFETSYYSCYQSGTSGNVVTRKMTISPDGTVSFEHGMRHGDKSYLYPTGTNNFTFYYTTA